MIVCSCNGITRAQILETAQTEAQHTRRSPAQTYRCLGCAPECGRCLVTVRQILAESRAANCNVGCAGCPGNKHADTAPEEMPAYLKMAAE